MMHSKIVLVSTVLLMATCAAFIYLRGQPQKVASKFKQMLVAEDNESALNMVAKTNVSRLFNLGINEKLSLDTFEYEKQSFADWFAGRCPGKLRVEVKGGDGGISYVERWDCLVDATPRGIVIASTSRVEVATALVPSAPYRRNGDN